MSELTSGGEVMLTRGGEVRVTDGDMDSWW